MAKKPNLKNYTTAIPEGKTIMEIEQILAQFRATAILKDYQEDGSVKAISFKIMTEYGEMPFKIPMDDRAIAKYRSEQFTGYIKKENTKNDLDTARKIGWRIIKDWIHSQLSIVQLRLVKVEEVFLPYMFNYNTNKTFYKMLEEKKFKGMLLEDKNNQSDSNTKEAELPTDN